MPSDRRDSSSKSEDRHQYNVKFILATDGDTLEAEDIASGETVAPVITSTLTVRMRLSKRLGWPLEAKKTPPSWTLSIADDLQVP